MTQATLEQALWLAAAFRETLRRKAPPHQGEHDTRHCYELACQAYQLQTHQHEHHRALAQACQVIDELVAAANAP
jgi:hypothetical protein